MPIWPFTTTRKDDAEIAREKLQEQVQSAQATLSTTASKAEKKFYGLDQNVQVIAGTLALTTTVLLGIRTYKRYLRRVPSTDHIRPDAFHGRSLFGKVTYVGDGDGFRFFHTPGGRLAGWGWLRSVPTDKKELKGQTLSVRLAGVDAPEIPHFGKPGQPYGQEALDALTELTLGRRVRVFLWRRDQYERVVGSAYYRKWGIFKRDVSLDLLNRGLATVYEGKINREFGGHAKEKEYFKAQDDAKRRGVGMWAEPGVIAKFFGAKAGATETPRAFKDRHMSDDGGKKGK